jgi:AAA+ superfamily predicted ATPase
MSAKKAKTEKTKSTKFESYLRAGYPALWVQTDEEDRALRTLYHESGDAYCYRWDLAGGLVAMGNKDTKPIASPVEALKAIVGLDSNSVLFLLDFHPFLKDAQVYRTLKNLLSHCKATSKHFVIISPVLTIPAELAKAITVIEWTLPDLQDLQTLAWRIIEGYQKSNNTTVEYDASVMAYAKGLTAPEAENAVARSLAISGKVEREILEQEKLQTIKKTGLMEIYPAESADSLRGLDLLKQYIEARKKGFTNPALPTPKGILLAGPPGTGKSLSAKVISGVLGFPLLKVGPEAFKGGIVGESEAKTKQVWKIAKASAPCVLWIDEVEKVFGGAQSSNKTDGGAGAASFGIMLSEMQELKEPVYIVATCNDIDDLLAVSQGAIMRRFDDTFFIDLPTKSERADILDFMVRKYGLDPAELSNGNTPSMNNWSGAEIEKLVKGALYDGADIAAHNVHPIYEQNREAIDRARIWARANARPASTQEGTTQTYYEAYEERSVKGA